MPTDRSGLLILPDEECLRLLNGHLPRVGRVAFVHDGLPLALPVNYLVDHGAVVFRAETGSTLAAAAGETVAFEVDEVDASWQEGWSVVVRGTVEAVDDPAELERLRRLPLQSWAPGEHTRYMRIVPISITGRRIV